MMELAGRRTLIDPIDLIDWHSGKLLRETITTTEDETSTTQILDFFYDSNGTPLALKTNDIVYYYVTNLQGDVIQLIDSTGTAVAAYEYDPYGNIVSQTGDLADLNPLRYRGYYYDKETGLYYLQSRYYDPAIARFINADSYASTGQGVIGYNMFAYCMNNPVMLVDYCGTAPHYIPIAFNDEPSELTTSPQLTLRDVTDEISIVLIKAATRARALSIAGDNSIEKILYTGIIYVEFYNLVNHGAPWDIKLQSSWEATIGTPYPGFENEVYFCGNIMTPQSLGNFTYGYLGYSYGIPYSHLIVGSYVAADFPIAGFELYNEIWDWQYITLGYIYAKNGYLEGEWV